MTPIGVVCVGAGWVTTHRHLPALMRDRRARVIGVIDRNASRAEALAARYRLPHWGTDIDASWLSEATGACIGTPPASHSTIATALLRRGLHVLCEKPLATSVADAEQMVACAAEHGRLLAVVHNFQFASATRRALRYLDDGRLGDLKAVYAVQLSNPSRRLPSWYPTLRGGLFYDEAPHLIYLLRRILGKLGSMSVVCRADRMTSASQVLQLSLVFDHPTLWAQLVMNFESPLSEWQLILVGTRCVIAVDIFRDISVVLPNDGDHGAQKILRTSAVGIGEHVAGTVRSGLGHMTGRLLYGNDIVIGRFLDAVGHGRPLTGISGADGLAVVRVLDEILEAASV